MEKALLLRLMRPELVFLKEVLDARVRGRVFFGDRRGPSPVETSLHQQVNDLLESKRSDHVPVS